MGALHALQRVGDKLQVQTLRARGAQMKVVAIAACGVALGLTRSGMPI